MKNKFILLISILFLAFNGFSQSACEDRVLEAEKQYEEGKYNKVVNILESVLEECDLSNLKKSELMKYLSGAYYEMDELEEADKYLMKFIKKNPYYELNVNNDPYAFREELNKFKTWPLFFVGVGAGIPINNIIVEKIYPVSDPTVVDYDQPITSSQAISFMFEFGWNINSYFSINSGMGVTLMSLSQSIPMYSGLNFNYTETIIQANIPAYFKFSYPLKNGLIPAIYFGGDITQLNDANYSYNYSQSGYIDQEYEYLLQRKRENASVDSLDIRRNLYRNAIIAGARLSYRLNRIQIYLDLRYRRELDLYNNPNERYFHPDLYISNNYVLPDFKIESYQISLGINLNFAYKVKSKY